MTLPLAISLLLLVILFENSLQLDAATLTLMSGHALGKQTSRRRLQKLVSSFTWGVVFIWWLLVSTTCLMLYFSLGGSLVTVNFWALLIILAVAQALILICLLLLHPNTQHPWVRQGFKNFLTKRAQKTSSTAEAFSLGVASVIGQLPVLIVPLIIAGSTLINFSNRYLIINIAWFSLLTALPLFIIRCLINSETSIATVQKFCWRNRSFFKGLLIISLLTLGLLALNFLKVVEL